MLRLIRRPRSESRDAGVALVAVIGLTAVMLLVVATALTGASSGLAQASSAQNTTRALDASYAGVQDYIAKLNADSTYPQYGNPASPFSGNTVVLPPTTNPAFGLGTAGTWAGLPGSTSPATFRYEVDNSLYGSSGLLRLRSTGRSGPFTKTIVASIQQQGFINYLYFTNYETADPQITGTGATCNTYLWSNPPRSTAATSCPTIQFGPQDVLQGPVRSNDTINVCGSTFNGPVTSSNPGNPLIATPVGCTQSATYASTPTYLPVLSMPATNTSMKAQTYSDTATNPGCLYTGPTQITLKNDGTMTVVSPWTQFTRTTSDSAFGSNPAACGSLTALHSTAGANIPVPTNNLVYVQGVPSVASDVNSTAATAPSTTSTSTVACTYSTFQSNQCLTSSGATCGSSYRSTYTSRCTFTATTTTQTANGAVPSSATQSTWNPGTSYTCTGPTGGNVGGSNSTGALATTTSGSSAGWIFQDASGKVQFPLATESPATNWSAGTTSNPTWDTTTPAYGCRNGDAFVSGTLSGKLTIASDNYIYATGDILYKDPSGDVLGLVGNNGVLVWNPMNGSTPLLTPKNREIDAAILSPAHTFTVQNYDIGPPRGVLTINGSIAQNYRGTVATTSGTSTATGYSKNYGYDARFVTVTPPYYLKPTSASFKVSSYASTTPVFSSTGATN